MSTKRASIGRANGQVGPAHEPPPPSINRDSMTKLKKVRQTQKDVKNEGCSQYVIENKGCKTTHFDQANMYMKTNDVSSYANMFMKVNEIAIFTQH